MFFGGIFCQDKKDGQDGKDNLDSQDRKNIKKMLRGDLLSGWK